MSEELPHLPQEPAGELAEHLPELWAGTLPPAQAETAIPADSSGAELTPGQATHSLTVFQAGVLRDPTARVAAYFEDGNGRGEWRALNPLDERVTAEDIEGQMRMHELHFNTLRAALAAKRERDAAIEREAGAANPSLEPERIDHSGHPVIPYSTSTERTVPIKTAPSPEARTSRRRPTWNLGAIVTKAASYVGGRGSRPSADAAQSSGALTERTGELPVVQEQDDEPTGPIAITPAGLPARNPMAALSEGAPATTRMQPGSTGEFTTIAEDELATDKAIARRASDIAHYEQLIEKVGERLPPNPKHTLPEDAEQLAYLRNKMAAAQAELARLQAEGAQPAAENVPTSLAQLSKKFENGEWE